MLILNFEWQWYSLQETLKLGELGIFLAFWYYQKVLFQLSSGPNQILHEHKTYWWGKIKHIVFKLKKKTLKYILEASIQ